MFLCIPRARAACCWNWWKRYPDFDGVARAPSPARVENLESKAAGEGARATRARIMLLLAADTSGKHGSIALARCGPGDACSVIEVVPLEGGTFSAQLVPQIAALLARHGFHKERHWRLRRRRGPGLIYRSARRSGGHQSTGGSLAEAGRVRITPGGDGGFWPVARPSDSGPGCGAGRSLRRRVRSSW